MRPLATCSIALVVAFIASPVVALDPGHAALASVQPGDEMAHCVHADVATQEAPAPRALDALVDRHLAELRGVGLGLSLWIDGYGEVAARLPDLRLRPASNQKILTAVAALEVLGESTRLTTEVSTDGLLAGGVLDGDLHLVGGGDATLTGRGRHSLQTLAQAVFDTGIRSITGNVVADESRYDTLREANGWRELNIPESVGTLSALVVDENRYRADWAFIANPALFNGRRFRAALEEAGVTVGGRVRTGTAPDGAVRVFGLASPTVADLVAEMLTESDNVIAELLVKEIGLVASRVGSTAAGMAAVRTVLEQLCLDPGIVQQDGSGLSHGNARSARGWREMLQAAQERPWWETLVGGLAVAGESGTLEHRFVGTAAEDNLRAKTGTITGLRSLTGIMTTGDGRQVLFSAIVDDDDPRPKMALVDELLVALAEYGLPPPEG